MKGDRKKNKKKKLCINVGELIITEKSLRAFRLLRMMSRPAGGKCHLFIYLCVCSFFLFVCLFFNILAA